MYFEDGSGSRFGAGLDIWLIKKMREMKLTRESDYHCIFVIGHAILDSTMK